MHGVFASSIASSIEDSITLTIVKVIEVLLTLLTRTRSVGTGVKYKSLKSIKAY